MTDLLTFAQQNPALSCVALYVQYLIACRLGRAVLILCRGWPPEHFEDGAWEPEQNLGEARWIGLRMKK